MIKEKHNEKDISIFKIFTLIIIYSIIIIFFIFTFLLSKVNAETVNGWFNDSNFLVPSIVQYFKWSDSTNYSSITTISQGGTGQLDNNGNQTPTFYVNQDRFSVNSNGFSIRISGDELFQVGYIYHSSIAICSEQSLSNVNVDYVSDMITNNNSYYFVGNGQVLSKYPYYHNPSSTDNTAWSYCYSYNGVFVPLQRTRFLFYKFSGTSNSTRIYLLGYTVHELGLYTETFRDMINDVISTSGLATASSLNEVNRGVNEVKSEVQAINQAQQETNETLTDSSIDSSNTNNTLNGLNNNIGTNSVISDLLLLPVTLFQHIVNSIDGSCSAFSLGTLFNHNLTMPCINLSAKLGSTLYGVIDVLISGFFILSIRKKFVDIFNNFTSLKGGGNELE